MDCTRIDAKQAAALLKEQDNILIISHKKPDGDTFGSGFGLLRGLWQLGKKAAIVCSDGFSAHYSHLYQDFAPENTLDFTPEFIVAADIADTQLFGSATEPYQNAVDLCIDHHPSNTHYAKYLYLEADSAATCELMYQVLKELGVNITPDIATAIYTGIMTDTGCFRYANTTARSFQYASELCAAGAACHAVAKRLLETKSRGRLEMERRVLDNMEYHFDGRAATLVISKSDVADTGVLSDELEGLSAIPRQIAGVDVGITFKEVGEQVYRVSMRTGELADASAICQKFGGGGHNRAAGCEMKGDLQEIKSVLLREIAPIFAS